ncbi:hypothetical protein CSB20_03860 [bacterium DOLZORAL124_64_63]|nr:MAG: hypothetical protein CSB20_03860 [bacterium DOLZORAL124_64_63]
MKKQITILSLALLAVAVFTGAALATVVPSDAVVVERIYNDSFASLLTVDKNYPSSIEINDEAAGPLGWANLHAWRFSENGTDPIEFDNLDGFAFYADLTISGTGDGEAGLQIRPWWSEASGRFNVRTPDGEVACFGGRLPFYSFTANNGVSYVKGTTVRLGIIYRTNPDMNEDNPATIEYIYDGISSGELPFDMGNPDEDPPHGLWGILSPAQAGGHMQFNNMSGAGEGANLNIRWENIEFQDLGTVVSTDKISMGAIKALYR